MQILAVLLSSVLAFPLQSAPPPAQEGAGPAKAATQEKSARQLWAVRGEVLAVKAQNKGMLSITVKPAKDFPAVTILARENDLVGNATGRAVEVDLMGLLAGNSRDKDETITAAELNAGDVVSVIYDPQLQNRALEIYLH